MKKTVALGSISIAYFLSVFALPSMWNHIFTVIALRFDLIPEQIPFIPMGFNLVASILGLPAVLRLIRRRKQERRSPAILAFLVACSLAVVLMWVGTIRWAYSDPDSMLAGLAGSPVDAREPSEYISGGSYHNGALGFAVNLPGDWVVLSSNGIRRAHAAGSYSISGLGSRTVPGKLPPGVKQFLAIKRFPETYRGYNPSLVFVSYEKGAMRRSGCSSLDALISPLASSGPPYRLLSGPTESRVGEFHGLAVRLQAKFPGATVRQYVYGFETESHYFTVTVAYQRMEDYAALGKAIRSISKIE
jgi:hypothetical protein